MERFPGQDLPRASTESFRAGAEKPAGIRRLRDRRGKSILPRSPVRDRGGTGAFRRSTAVSPGGCSGRPYRAYRLNAGAEPTTELETRTIGLAGQSHAGGSIESQLLFLICILKCDEIRERQRHDIIATKKDLTRRHPCYMHSDREKRVRLT